MSYIFNHELNAMDTVQKALDPLTSTARARVIRWVQEVFEEGEDAPAEIPAAERETV